MERIHVGYSQAAYDPNLYLVPKYGDCYPFNPRHLELCLPEDKKHSRLIGIRKSHEEALAFHGTVPRIDPMFTGR